MRHFSDFEKEIITDLVSQKPSCYEDEGKIYISNDLGKIAKERLDIVDLESVEDETVIKIVFIDNGKDSEEDKLFKRSMLFYFHFLIKYLENNYLLGLSVRGDMKKFTANGYIEPSDDNEEFDENDPISIFTKPLMANFWSKRDGNMIWGLSTSTHSTYTDLGRGIMRYIHAEYFPSQELKELVANDFKSREQLYAEAQIAEAITQTREAEKQTRNATKALRWSIWTVFVAILTLAASIILPIVLNNNRPANIEQVDVLNIEEQAATP